MLLVLEVHVDIRVSGGPRSQQGQSKVCSQPLSFQNPSRTEPPGLQQIKLWQKSSKGAKFADVPRGWPTPSGNEDEIARTEERSLSPSQQVPI